MDRRLSAALGELEAECRRLGAPLGVGGLRGATELEVGRAFESTDLVPNEELLTWFQWHNGWAEYCSTPDNLDPYDLTTAADFCRIMRDIANDVARRDGPEAIASVWRSSFFPISGASGDRVVVDTAPTTPEQALRYYYRDEGTNGAERAPSLRSLVEVWVADLRSGLTYWDQVLWEGLARSSPPRGF
jgi:hypothetical protein